MNKLDLLQKLSITVIFGVITVFAFQIEAQLSNFITIEPDNLFGIFDQNNLPEEEFSNVKNYFLEYSTKEILPVEDSQK